MASKAYGLFFAHAFKGEIPWLVSGGATVKLALLDSGYAPDQDADEVWGDISEHEVTGDGYISGGASVTLADPVYATATNVLKLDCSDVEWADTTLTARYAVLYVASETASERYLIAYTDFGEDQSTSGTPFRVSMNADGAVKVTVG